MPEERQQNDDGKWDTQQPQQQATTETHVCLLSSIVNAHRTGWSATVPPEAERWLSGEQNQQDDDRNGNAQQPQENRHCMLLFVVGSPRPGNEAAVVPCPVAHLATFGRRQAAANAPNSREAVIQNAAWSPTM